MRKDVLKRGLKRLIAVAAMAVSLTVAGSVAAMAEETVSTEEAEIVVEEILAEMDTVESEPIEGHLIVGDAAKNGLVTSCKAVAQVGNYIMKGH